MSESQIKKEIPDFQQPPDVGVLRNGAFLRLWIAQLLTQIGGNVVLYGLTVLVAERSSSTSALSLLFLSFLVPAVLLSPISGVWVDRLDKRFVLVVANLTGRELRAALPLGSLGWGEGMSLRDGLSGGAFSVRKGAIDLRLPGKGSAVLVRGGPG